MAVVSVKKMFTGRGGQRGPDNRITYSFHFEVITDDPYDDEQVVGNAVDPLTSLAVPIQGDPHPGDPNAVVTDVEPEQSDDSFYIWYVSVKYDTKPDTPAATDFSDPRGEMGAGQGERVANLNPNPLLRPAQWQISSIDRQEVVKRWVRVAQSGQVLYYIPANFSPNTVYSPGTYVVSNGNVYVAVQDGPAESGNVGPAGRGDIKYNEQTNGDCVFYYCSTLARATSDPRYAILEAAYSSARMPFDPAPMIDVSIPTIRVTKNVPFVSIEYAMNIKNAVNLTKWKNLPPRCAKVVRFEASNKQENNYSFVEATWEIGMDPDTWDVQVLDAAFGIYKTVEVNNPNAPPDKITKKIFSRFKDEDGGEVSSAIPLDGGGSPLPPGSDPHFVRGIPEQQKIVEFNQFIPF